MEHEDDGDTDCDWSTWSHPQKITKSSDGLGNKKTSGIHQNYSIVEIGQNTEKSSGN